MATFISLVNYTDQGIRRVKDSPDRIDAARQAAAVAPGPAPPRGSWRPL